MTENKHSGVARISASDRNRTQPMKILSGEIISACGAPLCGASDPLWRYGRVGKVK